MPATLNKESSIERRNLINYNIVGSKQDYLVAYEDQNIITTFGLHSFLIKK